MLYGFKNEEYYICSANRNRKTKETEKNCKMETIEQKSEELENRKTKLDNGDNRRIGTELWITTLILLFSDLVLTAPI